MPKREEHAKTNAMRALDQRHIAYTPCYYSDTIHSATEVAQLLGVGADYVFKTLVALTDDSRQLLIVTPGDRELDMRLVARGVGAKSVRMALQRDAERLTGLKVGGISPLALLGKRFEVYLDAPGAALDELYINGGQRGVNIKLRVADLLAITGARVIEATHPPEAS
ncbi:MAG TPA: YbaK/EbsC family protein [Ktedonobacterales bacterium]|jgi:Cys-tRNA(Pro)/Cys-tRNA(Cys) deacylase|nr:YbaK/EbsC family protein [Ktedonobacterales bacterium]